MNLKYVIMLPPPLDVACNNIITVPDKSLTSWELNTNFESALEIIYNYWSTKVQYEFFCDELDYIFTYNKL